MSDPRSLNGTGAAERWEAQLAAVARALPYPPTPDLTAAVVARTSPRLPAGLRHGSGEPAVLACHGVIDGQRVEGLLDQAQPPQPLRARVTGARDEHAEVQLGQGDGADGDLGLAQVGLGPE